MNQYPNPNDFRAPAYSVYGQPPQPGTPVPYGQPPQPGAPVFYGQPGCPPPFAVRRPGDPRLAEARKTFNRLCLVVLLQTAAAIAFEIPLTFLSMALGVNLMEPLAYQLLLTAMVPLSTALPFLFYLWIGKKDVTEYLRFEKVGFGVALLLVLAGLAVCLLGNFPSTAMQEFFGQFGYESVEQVSQEDHTWLGFALEFFSTAILVPVMEEFAFRGVLCSALRKYGAGFAIVASALVFSLVHLDFSNVIFAFVAGLVFGYLYLRTGNLWITIAIHALNNGLAVIGVYALPLVDESFSGLLDLLLFYGPIALGILALVLLLAVKRPRFFLLPSSAAGERYAGLAVPAVVGAPLFWVLLVFMAAYTTSLFF